MSEFFAERIIFATKMRTKGSIILLLAAVLTTGCKTAEETSEEAASLMLDEARELLQQRHYVAARDTILSLRRQHPTALETRRAAIITLDSVELLEARDSLLIYEPQLEAAKETFRQMLPRVDGHTNEEYYLQQRRVWQMEQHFDELCAKVKFYLRKIDIDSQGK